MIAFVLPPVYARLGLLGRTLDLNVSIIEDKKTKTLGSTARKKVWLERRYGSALQEAGTWSLNLTGQKGDKLCQIWLAPSVKPPVVPN